MQDIVKQTLSYFSNLLICERKDLKFPEIAKILSDKHDHIISQMGRFVSYLHGY